MKRQEIPKNDCLIVGNQSSSYSGAMNNTFTPQKGESYEVQNNSANYSVQ